MKPIRLESRFRRDVKRIQKRGKSLEKLNVIVDLLASDTSLPSACRPHLLTGNWRGYMECHIEPDWLLIYRVREDAVMLARTGSHADLFG